MIKANTSLSTELRANNDDWFNKIYEHPFVEGIRKGNLTNEQLIHYVRQDYLYLNAYIQLYGMAITKSVTREDMAFFYQGIGFILNDEVQPHHEFCRAAGVTLEEIQTNVMAMTTRNYRNHMFIVAQMGTLAELYAAMLPCPWTYEYIAQRMLSESLIAEDHPYYKWIHFYGKKVTPSWTEVVCAKLDALSANMTEEERLRMHDAFRVSCQMEYEFWEMSFNLED